MRCRNVREQSSCSETMWRYVYHRFCAFLIHNSRKVCLGLCSRHRAPLDRYLYAPEAMLRHVDITSYTPEYQREKGLRALVVFCVAHVAHAVSHAVDGKANLQVFCRENSGNECLVSICLGLFCVRRADGHACRAPHGPISMVRNPKCPPSHTIAI